ncbi:MAG: hypothetical protein N2662_00200 [Bacteroidales bacterium]|nr:hypothetical protein [Bacteroidales bacterium]
MKKILGLSIFCLIIVSCVSTHVGTISSSFCDKPFKYEDIAIGVAQTNIYFGFGGTNQDALVLEAKRALIKNRPLNNNEAYKDYTVDFKTTIYPFYIQRKVTVSADVISFTSDTVKNIYSSNYKNKLLEITYKNGLFQIGDTIYDKYQNQGIIISFESSDKVRIMYRTRSNKIRTKKMSIYNIFTKTKGYNGYKPGDWYGNVIEGKGPIKTEIYKIVGIGLTKLILEDKNNHISIVANSK